jgi:hypothetical protein
MQAQNAVEMSFVIFSKFVSFQRCTEHLLLSNYTSNNFSSPTVKILPIKVLEVEEHYMDDAFRAF